MAVLKKTCPSCGKTYPLTPQYFYRDRSKPTGFRICCKECMRYKKRDTIQKLRKELRQLEAKNRQLRMRYAAARALWTELFSVVREMHVCDKDVLLQKTELFY